MADDGMLLNFEIPSDTFAPPKKTFKGGTWKDRLSAKKSLEYGRRKQQEREANAGKNSIPDFGNVGSEDEELVLPEEPASKRVKTGNGGEFKPRQREAGKGSGGRPRGQHEVLPKTTNGEVISSLFTYNPEYKAALQQPDQTMDDTPIQPSNAPISDELATFTKLGLSPLLASHLLNKLGITAPTAVQRKAVEQLCKNNTDAFIQAETGSGKTLAYLLPVVQRISNLSKEMKAAGQEFTRESGLFGIVLAPTRELAKQIETVLESLLSCCHWIVGGIVIGGEKKKSEKARLRKGVNILVATPGRLADHLDHTEVLDVSRVRWVVLDEGDRLMELGFEKDIQKIVSVLNLRTRKVQTQPIPGLPERRTTVLCSATLKADVEQLRTIALKDPVTVSVDAAERSEQEEQAFSAPAQLKQSYAIVPAKQRLVTLVAALKQAFKRKGTVMKCIVFMSCADSVDFHFEVLSNVSETKDSSESKPNNEEDSQPLKTPKLSKTDKIPQGNTISESRTQAPATACSTSDNPIQLFRLHGSLQQSTRTSTLKAFTNATTPSILVCTDVASRGLDLPNVDLVLEYDPPFSKADHLHRVGRTARAGKDGRAMIFLLPGSEEGYIEILREGRPRNLTRHDGDELLKKGFAPTSGVVTAASNREWEQRATDVQLAVERWALAHPKHLEQARRAFQSHIRAYATHIAGERAMFDMKQMHLGHLAKAFALRDKPGSLRVPGLRPGKEAGVKSKEARKANAGLGAKRSRGGAADVMEDVGVTDEQAARRKMQSMSRAMGGASEFNLG